MSTVSFNDGQHVVRLFYLREAPGLPPVETQKNALGLGDTSEEGGVYLDLSPKRRRATLAEPYPQLAEAVRALRVGDELAVAIPAVMGSSRGQVLDMMQAIGNKQANVYNAEKSEVIRWSPDALKVLRYATEAETFTRSYALKKARMRRADLGRGNGVVPKLAGRAKETALKIWLDPERTGKQAAAEIGVSPSTAYRNLGPRYRPLFGKG